ncbi:hypothetical protein VdG1_01680 [Verticillium dahliae VDG1]|nr:hypothetical protein VdG1_01680 [Verticillium dahliae VDG1]
MSPSADPSSPISTETTIAALRKSITSEATPLPLRFRALFSLKHLATVSETAESNAAIDAIAAAFASPSALLKHELAYCLGQTGNLHAVEPLRNAAEALGALGDASQLDILRQFRDREGEEVVVTETCEIAIDRLEWETSEQRKQEKLRKSDFTSIDPAPPMEESQRTVDELEKNLMDQSKPLFEEGVEATLLKFLHDDEKVVRESVIVALDMAEYEASGQTEYALIPEGTKVSA